MEGRDLNISRPSPDRHADPPSNSIVRGNKASTPMSQQYNGGLSTTVSPAAVTNNQREVDVERMAQSRANQQNPLDHLGQASPTGPAAGTAGQAESVDSRSALSVCMLLLRQMNVNDIHIVAKECQSMLQQQRK